MISKRVSIAKHTLGELLAALGDAALVPISGDTAPSGSAYRMEYLNDEQEPTQDSDSHSTSGNPVAGDGA
jgi:hypothetical protein